MNQNQPPTLWEKAKALAFFCFPHHLVSRLVFVLARLRTHRKAAFIRFYIRFFNVNMEEAEHECPEDYATFNDFFTRKLKAAARPICEHPRTLACPCDGMVSESGNIRKDFLLQTKGQNHTLCDLFGGAYDIAAHFSNGMFISIYLAPGNYHRVHLPADGRLTHLLHVPGRLFSVAAYALKTIASLYGRNERVITVFETALGKVALVMVGALNVGSISISRHGIITPRGRAVERTDYATAATTAASEFYFKRGEEIGCFNLGSTVILLTENSHLKWNPAYAAGNSVRMGEELAYCMHKAESS